jgi:hypothetical protein
MNEAYSHKPSSTMSFVEELSSISIPSHVLAKSRVLDIIGGICKGFSTSSKNLVLLFNARIW